MSTSKCGTENPIQSVQSIRQVIYPTYLDIPSDHNVGRFHQLACPHLAEDSDYGTRRSLDSVLFP